MGSSRRFCQYFEILTCILIKATFPSTNQHPCTFSCFKKSFNTHARCTRKCFCTTKNNFWVAYWPLTKAIVVRRELWSCTCSWGRNVCFLYLRLFYSRLLKKNLTVEIFPKEEQGWKSIRKWADIWRSANSVQQIRKWRAYCDPCTTTVFISDDRHPHEWPPRFEF